MSRGTLFVVLLILVIAGGGAWYVWGQNDKSDSSAPESIASTSSPESGDSSSAAPAANASQSKGEAWTKRCDEKNGNYCEVFQRLIVKENNLRLLEFAIGYPKDSESAQAVIVLPLGVIVSEGIVLKVDETGAPNKAMIRSCNQEGCYVVMNLPADFVDTMKTGKQMIVSFLDGTGKQLNVGVTLQGFAEKLAEVAK